MKQRLFRDYGLGVGLRPCHLHAFQGKKPASLGWIEALTENYLGWPQCPRPSSRPSLLDIRRDIPVALHGVTLSIGSTDPLNFGYLKTLKELVGELQPLWVSDHLCWTWHDGENLHDLMPLPYTREAVDLVVERTLRVQDALGSRILLENVSSYLEYRCSEMTEWEFLAEIARRADCGILLDVNNVYVSSVNHGFDPIEYLKAVPAERVGQVHLAGHTIQEGYLIDTHDEPVCDEVWDLFRWTTRHLGRYSTMVERDDNIPAFEVLEAEVLKAGSIRDEIDNPELHTHETAAAPLRDSIAI